MGKYGHSQSFAADLEKVALPETIETVVIGPSGGDADLDCVPEKRRGAVLTWEVARPLLDYEYYHGSGDRECNPVFAWTATRVLVIAIYDGSTWVEAIPRNPVPCEPEYVGC